MNKLLRNKKADFLGLNVLYHILEIIFIITVVVFVIFIVHVDKDINTFPIESEILLSKILYSNNGLWFYDNDIGRLYPGILEFKNFNDKENIEISLNNTLYYGGENERAAAKLILIEDQKEFDPIYYNEPKYEDWIPQYMAGWTEGAGAIKGKPKKINILIKREDELTPGTLDITVIIPNR